jgi:hypothetical protein
MRAILIAALAAVALLGCDWPGDTTNAPTAGKEYWVNKDGTACTVDPAKGTTTLAGPFATRDDAKRAKDAHAECKAPQ